MTVLAADMWPIFHFGDANKRYQHFLGRGRPPFERFLENILLYDQIVVPTQDFMSLTVLVGVLGEDAVCNLIESDVLQFLRIEGSLAYVGNGGGLLPYIIRSPDDKRLPFCAPIDEAVEWSLAGLQQPLNKIRIHQLVTPATRAMPLGEMADLIRHETYMDILNSRYLRGVFAIRNKDMNHLHGIGPAQVRIYGGADTAGNADEIERVLRLAHTNLELRAAQISGCDDMSTSNPVDHLLTAKAERVFRNYEAGEAFSHLVQIADVPDVPKVVLSKEVDLLNLIRLRDSRDGRAFRKWFHENCRGDPIKVGREYAALLRSIPRAKTAPVRVIRFLITSGLGILEPILGTIAGTIDSFVIENIARGASPKFFLERLSQISGTQRNGQ
jgi:hypothetical protein